MTKRIDVQPVPMNATLDARGFHLDRDECGNWIIGRPSKGELITLSITEMVWLIEMIGLLDKPLAGVTRVVTCGDDGSDD